MEAVHWVSNGSQSNLHHSQKHTDSAVYLGPVQKKCQLYDAQFMAIQKNYERLCQKGKACNTERNVIKSERLTHKNCKFPILVIKIIGATKEYSLFQKQCVKVQFHYRVQFFHADQWKLLLQDNQK